LFRHGDRTAYRADPTAGTYRCAWVELHGDGLTTHWAWLLARCGAVVAGDAAAAMARAVEDLLAVAERAATGPSARFAAVARFVAALVAAAEGDRRRAGSAADLAVDEIIADPARIGRIAGHARRWRLSREHLSRCFHRRTGRPLTAWLAERRLAAARLLLAGTALDAAAVAAQSGFASSTALRRALRAAGLPAPQAWRQRTAE
jgi:transcriptional regulator GlxA family with amidase domain